MHVKCPRCDGVGKEGKIDCPLCNGRGHVEEKRAREYALQNFDCTIQFWNQDDHRREEG